MRRDVVRLLILTLIAAVPIAAHVGSPDVFFDGVAGPYRVLIAIRPPVVIPGLAQVEVRASTPGIQSMTFLPMPLAGIGSKLPPTADVAARSSEDTNLFTGQLWLMDFGSWQVKVHVKGDRGEGDVAVPVAALATGSKGMDKNFGRLLFAMMVFLVVGLVSIVGAAVRESTLAAGREAPSAFRPKSVAVMLGTSALAIWILYAGNQWWGSEAVNYSRKLYRPLDLSASVLPGQKLDLRLSDARWLNPRRLDDLEPDHGHLMHLYAIRAPRMDAVFHLHPEQVHDGVFVLDLPPMPPGKYQLFADIVHESGLGETATGEMEIITTNGTPLAGDNAGGMVNAGATVSPQADRTSMVWVRGSEAIHANQVQRFVFRIGGRSGQTAFRISSPIWVWPVTRRSLAMRTAVGFSRMCTRRDRRRWWR